MLLHIHTQFVCYDAGERTGAILNHVVIAACSSSVGVMTKLCPLVDLVAAKMSTVHFSLAACPQSLVYAVVSSGRDCWCMTSKWRQVCRMCSGVCCSQPHLQWAELVGPNLLKSFLGDQCTDQ